MIVHLKTQIDSTARLRTLLRATELCGFVLTKEAKNLSLNTFVEAQAFLKEFLERIIIKITLVR